MRISAACSLPVDHKCANMHSHAPPQSPRPASGEVRQVCFSSQTIVGGWTRRSALLLSLQLPIVPVASAAGPNLQLQYDGYSATYDQLDNSAIADALGFPDLRKRLLSMAHGKVLEVGVGTGLNLPLYRWDAINQMFALDLSTGMLEQARTRSAATLQDKPLEFIQGDVTQLPFPSGSFDCVVDTFSMCVFPQPALALAEMARVLRPGGSLLLLEHSRSTSPLLGLYQDLTASTVASLGKGCYWNQDIPGLLKAAALEPRVLESHLGGLITLVEAQPRV